MKLKIKVETVEDADVWLKLFAAALFVPLIGTIWEFSLFDVLTYLAFVFTVWAALYAGRAVFSVNKPDLPTVSAEKKGGQNSLPSNKPQQVAVGDGDGKQPSAGKESSGNVGKPGGISPPTAFQDQYARKYFWVSLFFLASAAVALIPTVYRAHESVFLVCIILLIVTYTWALGIALLSGLNRQGANGFLRIICAIPLIVFDGILVLYCIIHVKAILSF